MQHLSLEELLQLAEEAFSEEVFASLGDYFGSPSAHVEGKEEFLKSLRKKIEEKTKA
jgi:hypothetical protein